MSKHPEIEILLNSIALEPNRWTPEKIPYFSLIDLLPKIAEHGFFALEVWQFHVDRLSSTDLMELRATAAELEINMPVMGIYPTIHRDGKDGIEDLDSVVRLLDTATFLGSDMVKLFVGSVAAHALDKNGLERAIHFLQTVTEKAAERGIILTGETHANTLFDTVESTLRSLEQLDRSVFGVCFQPYDANLMGAKGAFEALRPSIWHLHFQGRKDDQICLLEEADLDYGAYVSFLRDTGFEGRLCIEFVKDCVVSSPELLDVDRVLTHAATDRAFIERHLEQTN